MKPDAAKLVLGALLAENGITVPKGPGEADLPALLHALLDADPVPGDTARALAEIFDAAAAAAGGQSPEDGAIAQPRDTHA